MWLAATQKIFYFYLYGSILNYFKEYAAHLCKVYELDLTLNQHQKALVKSQVD